MEEIKKAIIAHIDLLSRDELILIYMLIRKLVRK